MKAKEFSDISNFILEQYAKGDVIIVPVYCDVYIVDGDSEIKIEKADKENDDG